MKKDKNELYKIIMLLLKQHNRDKIFVKKMNNFMIKKNITLGRTMGILNTNIPIQMVTDIELCLLTISLYEITGDTRINPTYFYHDDEIKEADLYKVAMPTVENLIIINNIDQIADNIYVANMVLRKDIANWFNIGQLTYNKNTQRPTKKFTIGNDYAEMADINPQSVEDMVGKMHAGLFISNIVTLNLRKTGLETPPKYFPTKRMMQLTIDNIVNFLDIPDGMHRIASFVKVLEQDPKHTGTTMLRIMYAEEKEVGEFIKQEATHNDLPEEQIQYFDTSDKGMELTKAIEKETGTNALFQKFAHDAIEIEYGEKLTTYSVFSQTLKELFKFNNGREQRLLKDYLVEGFNEITGILYADFDNVQKSREKRVVTCSNMFIGYLTILSKLLDHHTFKGITNWQDKLETVLIHEDFSKDRELWSELGIANTKTNKTTIKKISSYFDTLL